MSAAPPISKAIPTGPIEIVHRQDLLDEEHDALAKRYGLLKTPQPGVYTTGDGIYGLSSQGFGVKYHWDTTLGLLVSRATTGNGEAKAVFHTIEGKETFPDFNEAEKSTAYHPDPFLWELNLAFTKEEHRLAQFVGNLQPVSGTVGLYTDCCGSYCYLKASAGDFIKLALRWDTAKGCLYNIKTEEYYSRYLNYTLDPNGFHFGPQSDPSRLPPRMTDEEEDDLLYTQFPGVTTNGKESVCLSGRELDRPSTLLDWDRAAGCFRNRNQEDPRFYGLDLEAIDGEPPGFLEQHRYEFPFEFRPVRQESDILTPVAGARGLWTNRGGFYIRAEKDTNGFAQMSVHRWHLNTGSLINVNTQEFWHVYIHHGVFMDLGQNPWGPAQDPYQLPVSFTQHFKYNLYKTQRSNVYTDMSQGALFFFGPGDVSPIWVLDWDTFSGCFRKRCGRGYAMYDHLLRPILQGNPPGRYAYPPGFDPLKPGSVHACSIPDSSAGMTAWSRNRVTPRLPDPQAFAKGMAAAFAATKPSGTFGSSSTQEASSNSNETHNERNPQDQRTTTEANSFSSSFDEPQTGSQASTPAGISTSSTSSSSSSSRKSSIRSQKRSRFSQNFEAYYPKHGSSASSQTNESVNSEEPGQSCADLDQEVKGVESSSTPSTFQKSEDVHQANEESSFNSKQFESDDHTMATSSPMSVVETAARPTSTTETVETNIGDHTTESKGAVSPDTTGELANSEGIPGETSESLASTSSDTDVEINDGVTGTLSNSTSEASTSADLSENTVEARKIMDLSQDVIKLADGGIESDPSEGMPGSQDSVDSPTPLGHSIFSVCVSMVQSTTFDLGRFEYEYYDLDIGDSSIGDDEKSHGVFRVDAHDGGSLHGEEEEPQAIEIGPTDGETNNCKIWEEENGKDIDEEEWDASALPTDFQVGDAAETGSAEFDCLADEGQGSMTVASPSASDLSADGSAGNDTKEMSLIQLENEMDRGYNGTQEAEKGNEASARDTLLADGGIIQATLNPGEDEASDDTFGYEEQAGIDDDGEHESQVLTVLENSSETLSDYFPETTFQIEPCSVSANEKDSVWDAFAFLMILTCLALTVSWPEIHNIGIALLLVFFARYFSRAATRREVDKGMKVIDLTAADGEGRYRGDLGSGEALQGGGSPQQENA